MAWVAEYLLLVFDDFWSFTRKLTSFHPTSALIPALSSQFLSLPLPFAQIS